MLDYKYADLFYEDSIGKQLKIEAEDGTVITNEDIYLEEVTLQESICSDDSLTFGSCEASKFEIKIANRFSPLIDQWITVSEVLDGHEDDPFTFGKYKVQSDRPTADRIYREIVAYDAMYDIINADKGEVADWYNEILPEDYSTVTLKTFRTSFLNHFGIEEESISLPNDSMIVEKTISASELSGKAVINAICEINGCFGHIGRDGKFQYIFLNTIVSSEETSILGKMILGTAKLGGTEVSQELDASKYRASDYEDYECQTIDKVLIQETEDDAGGWAGDGDNCYTITDNFLVYGKDLEEIQSIAQTILSTISGLVYRPAEVTATGNPCIIVGDSISLVTKYQHIDTYVLERTLKGIQALVDTYVAEGTEIYANTGNSLESAIDQLKGKSNTLTRDLESTKSTIKDVEQGLSNEITQTADSLTIEIKNIKDSVDELDKTAITGSTIEYYQSDSPTELTGGEWSEDEPTWTEGTYIWVRTTIRTGDGNQTITEPVCITGNTGAAGEDGTPGPAGEDGRTSYFHVKYSPVADPTAEDMTETPSEYIGTYVDFTEADSTDPADYEWVKWLGEDGAQGIPGTNGQDGKTYYLHIAYANSEDGTVDFSTTDSEDKSYIGQYVDTEPDDSTNPSDYAWTKIKGEDGIGVESIVAYFAKSGSPDYYPTLGTETASILGEMILGTAVLGNTGTWQTYPPYMEEDDYLWLRFLVTYTDGTYQWTEPCCLTDKSLKQQVETLEEKSNVFEVTIDGLTSDVTSLEQVVSENYSYTENRFSSIQQTVESITETVSKTTETVDALQEEAITDTVIEYYLSTSPTELDGGNWSEDAPEWQDGYYIWVRTTITTGVGDAKIVSVTDPVCITGNTGEQGEEGPEGPAGEAGISVKSITAYYSTTESSTYYTSHGGDTTAVLGVMVLGTGCVGNSGTWTTDPPELGEYDYLWICYLVEYSDGSSQWTTPYCVTDSNVRIRLNSVTEEIAQIETTLDNISLIVSNLQTDTYEDYQEITKRFSEIVQTTDSISATVTYIQQDISENYSTKTEMKASIEEYVDESMAQISITISTEGETYEFYYIVSSGFPSSWTKISTGYGEFEEISDPILGDCYQITKTRESEYNPGLRYDLGSYLPAGTYHFKVKMATTEGHESTARGGYSFSNTSGDYESWETNAGLLKSDEWTEIEHDFVIEDMLIDPQSVRLLGRSVDDPILFQDPELIYEGYASGGLGGTAGIIISSGGKELSSAELDLSNVRAAFANDTSRVTISGGTISFLSKTLTIESEQFSLDINGNAVFGGNLDAVSGSFEEIYTLGHDSYKSTTDGVHIGRNISVGSNFRVEYTGNTYVQQLRVFYSLYMAAMSDSSLDITDSANDYERALLMMTDDNDAPYLAIAQTYFGRVAIQGQYIQIGYSTAGTTDIQLSSNDDIDAYAEDRFYCHGNFTVSGTKNRAVETKDFGWVEHFCYETASPYFGDMGSGKLDDNGECYVSLDEIFIETIGESCEYLIFLTATDEQGVYVDSESITRNGFVVKGVPNARFYWEVRAKQKGYESYRLDNIESPKIDPSEEEGCYEELEELNHDMYEAQRDEEIALDEILKEGSIS